MDGQNILNEISARYFGNENPPARSSSASRRWRIREC